MIIKFSDLLAKGSRNKEIKLSFEFQPVKFEGEEIKAVSMVDVNGQVNSKDEILDHYNNIVQSAGAIELTGKSSLEGTKEKGIDDYTGTYTADYEDFSDTEYLFGGTSIKREAGKELSIDCTLEVTEGTAKVFWISGSDKAVTLIETTGTYSDTITLPDGGNYIGIECESFTGSIELNIE